MTQEFEVDATDAGSRLDTFLSRRLLVSRRSIQKLLEAGSVKVDGLRARKGSFVSDKQRVEVEREALDAGSAILPSDAKLHILWEDAHLVVVDKPSGIPTLPLKPNENGTLANALVARYPEMQTVGDDPREAGLAHRLDTLTSGAVVAARDRATWEALRKQFSAGGQMEKHYAAVAVGPLADTGVIEIPLENAGDHVRHSADGRPARTRFTVQARHGAHASVALILETGLMHQARAHLAAVGAPILGDALYGGPAWIGLERFFLHASRLVFSHPKTRERIDVTAPLPQALADIYRIIFRSSNHEKRQ